MIVQIDFGRKVYNSPWNIEVVQRMSQADVKYVRVLPKDKIYRNIFEAGVSR